jgi:uncharacterized SAM-binding protein YcdF (DUF218 family)
VKTCAFGEIYHIFIFTNYYIMFRSIGFGMFVFHGEIHYPIIRFYFEHNYHEEIGSQVT